MDLNARMEIDHVIRIREGGGIEDVFDVNAPESFMQAHWDEHGDAHIMKGHEEDYVQYIEEQGWTLLRGWSGAYMAGATPIMHECESIGGRMEEHIRENPGLYVALSVEIMPPNSALESELVGWAVAFRSE